MINITDHITIPDSEVTFTTARSSGPGGQHVNNVSSRVTLHFNVLLSQIFTPRRCDADTNCVPSRENSRSRTSSRGPTSRAA